MIRSRQQDRPKQVRSEKALLEKQEQLLKLREEQLVQEHKRQERLREEAVKLKKQEEEIRRRQEEIAKELMASDMSVSSVDEVMVCEAREGQVFVGKKPHYLETMLDSTVVDVQQLNTSDWSSSDAESIQKESIGGGSYKPAGENYDPPFLGEGEGEECEVLGEEEGQWISGSSDEDTMEEELYECKVEVKQQNTLVPTSVRTIESVIDVPGWAPVTPYLNMANSVPTSQEELKAILSEAKTNPNMQYITAGVITSPESVMTSTRMITTPESSVSLQSQMSLTEQLEIANLSDLSSSWPGSPIPPVPPPPKESQDLMAEPFQTVQPDVPPRDDSFAITAVYSSGATGTPKSDSLDTQASKRRSLIEVDPLLVPKTVEPDPQLSPRLGGPGSAFKPYASSENLFDPSLFPSHRPPLANGSHHNNNNNNGDRSSKRYSNSSMKPPKIEESDEDFFKPRVQPKQQPPRGHITATTTDTEPEMREFNLGPIGSDKKLKKQQKAIYSTSETEEEYQAYMKAKPKWHGKGGHKDSWDPLQIASPPQIVQRPVGVVQKPKPQAKVPQKIERGAQVYPASLQIYPGPQGTNGQGLNGGQQEEAPSAFSVPKNYERIQKSDSIIEMKMVGSERVQKSASIVEVVPLRQVKKDASPNPQALPLPSMKELSPIQQTKKEPSPFQQVSLQPMKESSPYQQQPTSPPYLATKESSPYQQQPTSPPYL